MAKPVSSPAAQLVNFNFHPQSLKQVQLRWVVAYDGEDTGKLEVHASIVDRTGTPGIQPSEWLYSRAACKAKQDYCDIPQRLLVAGHTYDVTLKLLSRDRNSADDVPDVLMKVTSAKSLNFRLGYTMDEMKKLQAEAIKFVLATGRWRPCDVFYRDKNKEYYDYCLYQCNGFIPVMLKNENGDPASPINGLLRGTNLAVCMINKTGQLPTFSPFGSVRFQIPVICLYGPRSNLYFADFYCHAGSKSHRVTLVLTNAGSPADIFCERRLPKLNRTQNPFLYQNPSTRQMHMTSKVWIDIFYTEDISMNWGSFDIVPVGDMYLKMGHPKNPHCTVCNIYKA